MKKTQSALIGLLVFASVATAQQYRTNIFGIRAGYSLSDMTGNYLEGEKISDPRSSFHVGVSDQILLSRRYPLYLETGLYLSNKGAKLDIAYEDVPGTSQIRPRIELMYLQLPVMIAYHFRLGRATTLQPFVGGYYSVGISCKLKEEYSGQITGTATTDLLHGTDRNGEAPQRMKRSDAGIRLGVGLTLRNVYLGVGYELGLMNVSKYPDRFGKTENNALTVSAGYNF